MRLPPTSPAGRLGTDDLRTAASIDRAALEADGWSRDEVVRALIHEIDRVERPTQS